MNLNLLVHPSKRKGGAKSGEKWATRPKARDWRTTENMSLTPWEGSWWLRSRHPVVQGGRADRMCQFCCAVNSKGIRNCLQRVLWCVFLAQETGGDQIQMQLQQPFSHNSASIIYRTWLILLQNLCSVLVELDVPPFLSVWSQIRLATSISGENPEAQQPLWGSAPLFCPSSRHCAHLEPQKQPMPAWKQHDPQRICRLKHGVCQGSQGTTVKAPKHEAQK